MGPNVPGIGTDTSSPEANLDKMIAQQNRMFSLEIKKEMAKEEHDMKMGTARALGQAAEKA